MGGGDLNLKKSWHPHTMKNQEKVWKAEQAKQQEQKKLHDLRKELEEERNREDLRRIGEESGVLQRSDDKKKLEWMYKSGSELINREEYLLGRSVDKSFESLQAEEKQQQNAVGMKQPPLNHVEHECIPFSIRSYRGVDSTEQVDLQRKVMEDPLMLIKQREMESRRRLLENPVKLKELHRILKAEQQLNRKMEKESEKKSKKSKKSKKKHKKHSKSRHSSSSSSSDTEKNSDDSDQDLDKKLAKRYQKLKGSLDEPELAGLNLNKLLDAKYETIARQLDKATDRTRKKSKKISRSRSRTSSSPNSYQATTSKSSNYRREKESSSNVRRYQDERRRNDRRQYDDRSTSHSTRYRSKRSRSRSYSPLYNRREQQRASERNNRRPHHSRSRSKERREEKTTKMAPPPSKQRTEEEMEARRREMMENAAWRDEDRIKSVRKHREAYAREEKQNQEREFDTQFIQKEVQKAIANHTSIGSRIHANKNNIQRSSSAMDTNFARK